MRTLAKIEPLDVMYFFEELSSKHRCSRFEKQATDYIADFAAERGLEHHRDALENIIVKKPGTPGFENAPVVILHGHLDMVCKVGDGVSHDFAAGGVKLEVDGDRIRAAGTTLGADNGLGIAYMLTLLDSKDIPHPPLECVMTAMEEMGKVGGDGVDQSLLSGKRMIDFNWIDERQLLAGCSGDVSCRIDIDAAWQAPAPDRLPLLVEVRGLLGGHCEFDIHLGRANAIVVLGRLLRKAIQTGDVQVASVSGGVQNNVIPAEGATLLWVRADQVDAIEAAVTALADALKREFHRADPLLQIGTTRPDTAVDRVFSASATANLIQTIALLPNGIQTQNLEVPGNWETSNNIGLMVTTGRGVEITCTITSAVTSRKHAVLDQFMLLADMAGDGVRAEQIGLDAPEFPWNPDSPMLKVAKASYQRVMGRAPDVLVSVCSLELGMFTQRIAGLDTVGIGTNLYDLHSPKESLDHTSAARVWPLIKDVMRHLDH
ncbi:beta-Ala-His dipeptidase [Lichenihabitans sp. Uapishka_5]|uniref:beta-Ala-His dipeptidase n=1 Tax=Lichenihabitans sp. Uapishka_5 TaxID=3037302 RepID=UPI0029E819CD|nr:beta-Ala-His dipeptidase [Lichenihabitans sp. Uapishka_5]MDX7950305.1 beta-Ala-His dipeptidase [Lichenihabitans sp. Uapishka_5]